MLKNKLIYLLIIIGIFLNTSVAPKPPNGDGTHFLPSTIELKINSDRNYFKINQPILIYFNISNLNGGCARDIKFYAQLNDMIASPDINLKLSNKGFSKPNSNKFIIESFFDNNKDHNDEIIVSKNTGEIQFSIGKLEPGKNISACYTSFINSSEDSCVNREICIIKNFSWTTSKETLPVEIENIRVCPNDPPNFDIEIEPQRNVIYRDGLNYTIFSNSTVNFDPNDGILYFDHMQDKNISKKFNDGEEIKDIGNHSFFCKLSNNSSKINNNPKNFRVVDPKSYYKGLPPGWHLILAFIIVLIIVNLFKIFECDSKLIYINILLIIIAYVAFFVYYKIIEYYVDISLLETLLFFTVFQLSYLLAVRMWPNKQCICVTKIYELVFYVGLGIVLIIVTIILHYLIPDISTNSTAVTIFIGLIILILILLISEISDHNSIKSRMLLSTAIILAIILIYIYVMRLQLSFKPRFETNELVILSFLYAGPLVSIAASYLSPRITLKVLGFISKILKY